MSKHPVAPGVKVLFGSDVHEGAEHLAVARAVDHDQRPVRLGWELLESGIPGPANTDPVPDPVGGAGVHQPVVVPGRCCQHPAARVAGLDGHGGVLTTGVDVPGHAPDGAAALIGRLSLIHI